MRVTGNDTPHVWNYHLSMLEGSLARARSSGMQASVSLASRGIRLAFQ
jgi:peptide/nickel transport system substrate-binding protein